MSTKARLLAVEQRLQQQGMNTVVLVVNCAADMKRYLDEDAEGLYRDTKVVLVTFVDIKDGTTSDTWPEPRASH